MHIGVCTIDLRLPGNGSLKGKRSVIKSIVPGRQIGRLGAPRIKCQLPQRAIS